MALTDSAGTIPRVISQTVGALVGVAVGATLAFTAAYINERAKWNRSQAARWDERRLAAYVEYSSCIRRMQWLAGRIAAGRGLPTGAEPLATDEGLVVLGEAELARAERWQEVLLLGSQPAIDVGYDLNRCTWTLEWFARGKLDDSGDWQLAYSEAYRLRRRFASAARNDLGVTGWDSQIPGWQDSWSPESLLTLLRSRSAVDAER